MEAENAEAKNGGTTRTGVTNTGVANTGIANTGVANTEVTNFECFLKRFAAKISAKTREKYSQVKCPTSEQGSALK